MRIGIDIVEIVRFETMSDITKAQIFTPNELAYIAAKGSQNAQTAAGFFAAKEALAKALGSGLTRDLFHRVEVAHDGRGAPHFIGALAAQWKTSLSISHDGGMATAVVTLVAQDEKELLPYPEQWAHWCNVIDKRNANAHKYNNGRLFILAGSRNFSGAARLAAGGAWRMGVGLVTVGVPNCIHQVVASDCCENIVVPLRDDGDGFLSVEALPLIREQIDNADAVVVGPGLGNGRGMELIMREVLNYGEAPLIIDADGLNVMARHIYVQSRQVVLTPHEGEFRRIGGQLDNAPRLTAVQNYAVNSNCTVLLKGGQTVTACPDGRTTVNQSGNCGLAKGGSGDILAGMVGALAAQGIEPGDAAAFAAFVHGCAADVAVKKGSQMGMMPSDILAEIPKLLKYFDAPT
ncbi:MAG: NAD(P)H-hydrate dehydratase [Oscillospiraceae bacterium]|nr:NAD(P)H-hydrate dehydratase [Oscillospiraceae bacterium]